MAQERWYFQHGAGLMRSRRINTIRRRCGYGGVFSYMQLLEAAIPGNGTIPLDGDDEEELMDVIDPVDPEAVRAVIDLGIKKGWIVIKKTEFTIVDDVFSRPAAVPSAKPQKETTETEPEEEEVEATPEEIEQAEALFNELWGMYPNKKNRDRVTVRDKIRLAQMGRDECIGRMEAYKDYINGDAARKWATGSAFFSSTIFKFSAKKGKKNPSPAPVPAPEKAQDLSQEAIDEIIVRDGLKRANWETKKINYATETQAAIEAALTR